MAGEPAARPSLTGSHAGSHRGERPSGIPDGHEQRAGTKPRSRTDLNGSGCRYGNLRICEVGGSSPSERATVSPARRPGHDSAGSSSSSLRAATKPSKWHDSSGSPRSGHHGRLCACAASSSHATGACLAVIPKGIRAAAAPEQASRAPAGKADSKRVLIYRWTTMCRCPTGGAIRDSASTDTPGVPAGYSSLVLVFVHGQARCRSPDR